MVALCPPVGVSLSSAGQEPGIKWLLLFSFYNPFEEIGALSGGKSWESKRTSLCMDQREETGAGWLSDGF